MSINDRLRVIGARPVFENFLPTENSVFAHSEFVHISPGPVANLSNLQGQEGLMTLIVNPEDYGTDLLLKVQGPVVLWFLRGLSLSSPLRGVDAPKLTEMVREGILRTQAFVATIDFSRVLATVVADFRTQEYFAERGIRALLSPPPVGEISSQVDTQPIHRMPFHLWSEKTEYARRFIETIQENTRTQIFQLYGEGPDATSGSVISVGAGYVGGFPYEVAVALTKGLTVICERIYPTWGFEPGKDFIEISSPEELWRVMEYLDRNPSATFLMRQRAWAKSEIFAAGRIYANLIRRIRR